ncbi:hypothetical protein ACVGWC_23870, partial [Enterobacter hormaechei]
APDTVNPSLWRQSQLINIGGLFKVTDGVYQIRNLDLSNMTIIEGEKGITVIDPLLSAEPAKEALDLYYANRGKKPVVGVGVSPPQPHQKIPSLLKKKKKPTQTLTQ